jgi:serine/threonine-protein kinase
MMVGDVLADRYELEELVGTGGMSSVYRAHDRELDRRVALKILHLHFSDDDEYVQRFLREARTVAGLSHPNIVTVIDRGSHDGQQFIVFEYVEGETLKMLIQREGQCRSSARSSSRSRSLTGSAPRTSRGSSTAT